MNEEAIKELKEELKEIITWLAITINKEEMYERKERRKRAIEAALIALEQQPCEDAISRQAVFDNAYAYGNGLEPEGYCVNVEDIQALPSVTPSRPRGKWIEHPHECGSNWEYPKYECSKCHIWVEDDSDFCPCCGVDMRGDTDETN